MDNLKLDKNIDSIPIEITNVEKDIRTYVHISVDNVDNVDSKNEIFGP